MSPEKIPTRTRLALAQKLRFLRFTRGWSQEVLAELAEHFKDLGIEEPRAHYGRAVAVGMMH